jgi:hypothetical protein
MQDLHATIYHFSMEGRSHSPTKADKHMSDMRAPEELLPVLHA